MRIRDNNFLKSSLIGGLIAIIIAIGGLGINSNLLFLAFFSIGLSLLIYFWIYMTQFLYNTNIESSIWCFSLIIPISSVVIYVIKYVNNEEYFYYTSEERKKFLIKKYGPFSLKGLGNVLRENALNGTFADKKSHTKRN